MEKRVSISVRHLQNRYGDEQAIRIAKLIGADAIDFTTYTDAFDCRNPASIYSKSEDEFVSYFSHLKKEADQLGIEFAQTHARMQGYGINGAENEAYVQNARLDCLAAKLLGAPVCVVHSVSTLQLGKDAPPQRMHQLNFDMFMKILPFAKKYGVKLATETFGAAPGMGCCDFFGNIGEFVAAYESLCAAFDSGKYLTACVDTGHCNHAAGYGSPSPAEVIRILGKNVGVLHVNDNDGRSDQHRLPGMGNIPWSDVFDALDEIGYNGFYNMELHLNCFGDNFLIETAEFAVKLMKRMLADRYG